MMRLIPLYVAGFLVAAASPSVAQKTPSQARAEAKPGSCIRTGQGGIRECYPALGRGSFEIAVYPRKAVWVQLPEPIANALPPPARLFALRPSRTDPRFLTFIPLTSKIPATATAVLRTSKLTITLTFRVARSAKEADSQIHIVHFNQRGKDAETQRRLRAQAQKLRRQFDARLATVKKKAEVTGRRRLLTRMADGGMDLRTTRERAVARRSRLILRAKRRLRIGADVVVHFTLRNRSPTPFRIGVVQMSRTRDGAIVPLNDAAVSCGTRRLRPNQRTACYALLGVRRSFAGSDRLRIDIREQRGDRKVRLSGIDVR